MKKLVLIAFTLVSMNVFAAAPKCDDDATFPEISKADLKTQIANKTVAVVDVNGSKSFAKKHIDTAVDFETIKGNVASALPADKNALVVAYCGGPSCVAWKKAATEACKAGYTNVKHFKDGIKGW